MSSVFEGSTIDRDLAVPLYHQIYLQLRDEITSGQRPYGALAPTEQDLAETLGVSRITARRALDELAQHKLVERRRRIGTRVIFQSPSKPIEANVDQALESLATFGRNTKIQVMEVVEEPARSPVAESLDVEPGTPVVRAVRIRWLDDEPLGQTVSYTPARLGLDITRDTLTASSILNMIEDKGVHIEKVARTISATLADPALAQTLEVDARSPILRITSKLYDQTGAAVLLILAHYRADRYQISLDLHPGASREEG